jgi:hypothetical protein
MIGRDVESRCHGGGQRNDGILAVGDEAMKPPLHSPVCAIFSLSGI